MTTLASVPTARRGKTRAAFRLTFASPRSAFLVPLMIIAIIFVVNVAIWAIIDSTVSGEDLADFHDGLQWSGSSFYLYVYLMVFAVQAITISMPFALGYGITRKHYVAGTMLGLLAMCAIYAAFFTLMAAIETATNGWGLGGRMFTATYYGDGPWFEKLLVFFALLVFLCFVGAGFASVFLRWRRTGLLASLAIVALLIVGVIALIAYTNAWGAVGGAFATAFSTGGIALVAAGFLVVSAIVAGLTFLVLRRVTPAS